jgi:hypothetical protein
MSTVQNADSQRLQRLSIQAMRAYLESGLRGMEAEVVLALDVSKYMGPIYASGAVQELTESLLALGMCFDDDLTIPTWAFADEAERVGELSHDHFSDWMSKLVLPAAARLDTGCRYASVINDIGRRYFPQEWAIQAEEKKVGGKLKRTVKVFPSLINPRPYAVFVIVITAGDCADPSETIRALRRASHLPIFWQFAGIAPAGLPRPEFEFLKRVDRLTDRHVDNCGFFEPRDFRDPQTMFSGLLNEFPDYLALDAVKAMLLPPRDMTATGAVPKDEVDALLLTLPADVIARKERERAARARRRMARAEAGEEEAAARAAAVNPPTTASPETSVPAEPRVEVNLTSSMVPRLGSGDNKTAPRSAGRKAPSTRPYRVGTEPPAIPGPVPKPAEKGRNRLPTSRGARLRATAGAEPHDLPAPKPPAPKPPAPKPPPADPNEDPSTRLARIRARRAARRARAGEDDPTV